MMLKFLLVSLVCSGVVLSNPQMFHTEKFRVGIEYDNSLPMEGGSDRYRHRNNYDPFFVTVTTTAKKNFVMSYLDVTATVDEGGEIDFRIIRGQAGSKTMTFQLVSNHSDFLNFSYQAFGIREEEYRKVTNMIILPMPNSGWRVTNEFNLFTIFLIVFYNFS